MKSIVAKIVVSIVLVLIAVGLVYSLSTNNQAVDSGSLRIIIVDEQDMTVFDDWISFEVGDTLFDALDKSFILNYETYSFGKIVLGISNNEFNVQTNWTDDFLAFEQFDGTNYYLATQGVSNIEFKDGDQIRISVRSVSGGLS
ncbi:MAG: hypothetical protein JXC31_04370 [Acholeplasmataceae bacterium]|nr:hypothetical protein [Acholeplasmataceae bacterium]